MAHPATSSRPTAYFVRDTATRFRPTEHVGGGWDPADQHIAPTIGLLAHLVECDHQARRGDDLQLCRLSCDILGTMPLEPVEVHVTLMRAGRTIELLEARLSHGGREAVHARAWFTARYDTRAVEGSAFPAMPPPAQVPRWELDRDWPGGFVRSTQVRRRELAPGHVQAWLGGDVPLLQGEAVSPTAHMLRLVDVINGVAARVSPDELAFPNLDLTAHLFREPRGELIGLDSTSSIGPNGAGLTHSVLHDQDGPVGTIAQSLTVRPR